MMWRRPKNIDQAAVADTLNDGDRLLMAQGLSPIAKRPTLGALRTFLNAAVSTFSNKTINGANNTILNLATSMFAANVIDADASLTANSDARLATQKAVKAYVASYTAGLIAAADAMVFKGVVNCSSNPNYPAADAGWTYKVSVAGKIGGASGIVVEVGDILICCVDGTAAGTQAAVGASWNVSQANIDGAITGPASSTSGNIATFSGTSGKLVQDGGKALPAGPLVGTTDGQTLTNKTLTAATINGGAASALTGLSIRSSGAAFDLSFQTNEAMVANRFINWATNGADRGINLSGNITTGGNLVTTGGHFTATLVGTTNVTFPTSGTLSSQADVAKAVRGYIAGLTLSVAGATATFGISAGSATDSTAAALMTLGGAYTKGAGAWAVGSGNGALDTGAIANSTWYHVHLIKRLDTGVVDVLLSLSATAPTLPTNYTVSRRLGAMLTNGSAQWIKFAQDGNEFTWDVPVTDYSSVVNPGTAAVLRALSLPSGVNVRALYHARSVTSVTASVATLFSDPAIADTTPDFSNSQQIGNTTLSPFAQLRTRTDVSRQVRVRLNASDANISFTLVTEGWIDSRGQFA